ncbi:hypothetical protein ABT024_12535 [Streptomyces sp. NPDC002812]|uniref:hypothetical protein n=1 Tax=Streptomyces sp. NPDC002812 TaxID=3154434 RepID=UPI0033181DC3
MLAVVEAAFEVGFLFPALLRWWAAAVPSTAAPVMAIAAAIGPPASAAVASSPAAVFVPDRDSGTTG